MFVLMQKLYAPCIFTMSNLTKIFMVVTKLGIEMPSSALEELGIRRQCVLQEFDSLKA